MSTLSATAAPYRGASVNDAVGPDLRIVDACRNRTWLDIAEPCISGVRIPVDVIATTLDQWGGFNEVEKEWRWRQFGEAVSGLPSVTRDAGNRLRGFCLTHFGPPAPSFSVPRTDYWLRKERECAEGRVPTMHRSNLDNALSIDDGRRNVFYNASEEWVPLPQWPERLPQENLFRPGTAGLRGGVRFSRF